MLNVAVIGAGNWGKNLVRIFADSKKTELKYVVDSDPDTLSKAPAKCVKTNDYREALDDTSVEAAVICSSAVTHYEIAKYALNAGKHVFVEKPMTLEVAHSEELVKLADEKKLKLMVGHLLLYHPCVNAMREYILNGDIGDLYYLYSQRLNLGKVRSDENALLSFAPHDISVAIYLMGDNPVSVTAYGECYLQKGVEDVVFLNMSFPGGRMAHVHVSWLDPHKVRKTTVVGSKKMVVFDDMDPREKIRIYDKGVDRPAGYGSYGEFLSLRDGDILIPAVKMTEPLKIEIDHFIDCIVSNKTPRSDGKNGLIVTKVLEYAQKSLKNGGIPVKIN
jgi:predicted dehydrogenase